MVIPIEFATPEYDEAVALRTRVLREPLGLHYTPEQLQAEYSDTHLACFNPDGILVGCLILTPHGDHAYKMRQVAVLPECQGKGIGRKLVQESELFALRQRRPHIILHARDTAVPFYLKQGYQTLGTPFEEVGIVHFKMEKIIPINH